MRDADRYMRKAYKVSRDNGRREHKAMDMAEAKAVAQQMVSAAK